MKAIKKILAVLVCLCVVCSCAVFAVSAAEATGSITIQNPSHSNATVANKTFYVYKVFNATTNGANTSYSWYIPAGETKSPYYDFFFGDNGLVGKSDNGTVQEAVEKLAEYESNSLLLSQLAEDLHTYIDNNNIKKFTDKEVTDSHARSVTIDGLSLGYYLIYDATNLALAGESSVRSAVMLDTVNENITITLKANRPQILKQVKKHTENWGKGTSATIGDTVTFKISTAVPSRNHYSTYHYSIEDTMHNGMTLKADSIKVYYDGQLLTNDTDYDLIIPTSGDVDFKVDFTKSMKKKVDGTNADVFEINKMLTIEYNASVTDEIEARKANTNTAKLIYSNDPMDDGSKGNVTDYANVYSYQHVFTKYSQNADGSLSSVRLSGAEFQIYRVVNGADQLMEFTKREVTEEYDGEPHTFTRYVVADEDEDEANITTTLATHNVGDSTITLNHLNFGGHLGDVSIFGLSEGVYKIVETKAPDGYVLPTAPFVIEITDTIDDLGVVGTLGITGSHDSTGSIVNTNGISESILTVWAEITNKPGSTLPETGGMGTTIFTVLGIVMMVGAAAFFTSRKRSSVA